MKVVSIREAKERFSQLLRRVASGEEIRIASRGIPVARLVPVSKRKPERQLGFYGDTIKVAEDFDDSLPNKILDAFEGQQRKKW